MKTGSKIFFAAALLLLVCRTAALDAQTVADTQKRRDALERDIEILRKQLSSTVSLSEEAVTRISMIQAQVDSRKKLIASSDKAIADLNGQIAKVNGEVRKHQAVLDTLQTHYDCLVAAAYKNRDIRIWYMYILGSENLSQAFRRFGYFKGLSAQLASQARQIESARDALSLKKDELNSLRKDEMAVRDRRAKELEQLKKDEAQQKTLIAKLKRNTKTYKASITAKQREKRALDKKIEQMIAAASESDRKKKNAKPVDYTLAKSFEKNKGKLPWPVEGPVTEHFGSYRNKELRLSLFNNGINIACEPESLVKAVFNGVVSNVMVVPGYGQCILIQHGNYYTTYCKIKTALVHQGDEVTTGQPIGEVATILGKTQLYFLVWKKQYLNPENWLRTR